MMTGVKISVAKSVNFMFHAKLGNTIDLNIFFLSVNCLIDEKAISVREIHPRSIYDVNST